VYSGVWPLSYLSRYAVVVFTGLNYKACSLGLVHFTGETLSVCFENFLIVTVLTRGALQLFYLFASLLVEIQCLSELI